MCGGASGAYERRTAATTAACAFCRERARRRRPPHRWAGGRRWRNSREVGIRNTAEAGERMRARRRDGRADVQSWPAYARRSSRTSRRSRTPRENPPVRGESREGGGAVAVVVFGKIAAQNGKFRRARLALSTRPLLETTVKTAIIITFPSLTISHRQTTDSERIKNL